MRDRAKIINVVSGKGGTGKTLFCSILAELLGNQDTKVLVVDLDIYVRGLTALLYFHKGEVLNVIEDDELSVFDILYHKWNKEFAAKEKLGIRRYRSFDILPSVNRIDVTLDLDNPTLDETRFFGEMVHHLLELIPRDKYDYIILDCRAGYDTLVSRIHSNADFSICVQEDDYISDITANTLIKQLERDNSQKAIFRVVNKARNIHSFEEYTFSKDSSVYIGRIPFDMDVMNSFGEKNFWDDISKSLYKSVLSDIWNRIAQKMRLEPKLNFYRRSPLNRSLEKRLGVFTLQERVIIIFGSILSIMGFMYPILGRQVREIMMEHPERIVSYLIGFFGLIMISLVYFKRKGL
jgi:septum site-determining protein MinD